METKYLGKQSSETITADQLDLVPWEQGEATVTLHATEFTSHCPVTGQPDFAKLIFTYVPDAHIVETKSFKLWMWSFRDQKQFNEKLVAHMADEFSRVIKPKRLTVRGDFNIRGGVSVTAEASRAK